MDSETTVPQMGETSFWKATFNTTSALVGVGVIAIPYALSRGGWVSLLLCILIAMMTCYTGLLIKACMDVDPSISTYLDIVERAFGNKWRIMAYIFLNTELYLVALSLIIAESDNLHKLLPKVVIKHHDRSIISGRKTSVLISTGMIFPTMMLTNLSILSYVSVTGVFSSLLIMGSLISVGISRVGFQSHGSQLWNMSGIPTAISFYIFCFAGHPVLPSIYMSMRHTHQFGKVWIISSLMATTISLVTVMIGYLMFGAQVKSQITLNLPTSKIDSKIAIFTTLLIPVTRYALMVAPVASAIEGLISHNYQNRYLIQIVIRLAILVSTTILAFLFPFFEKLMGLLGSIFVVLASFLLPCACYIKLTHGSDTWSCRIIVTVVVMIFGIIASVLGTYTAIIDFVNN